MRDIFPALATSRLPNMLSKTLSCPPKLLNGISLSSNALISGVDCHNTPEDSSRNSCPPSPASRSGSSRRAAAAAAAAVAAAAASSASPRYSYSYSSSTSSCVVANVAR
jgi:hypothetical protein